MAQKIELPPGGFRADVEKAAKRVAAWEALPTRKQPCDSRSELR